MIIALGVIFVARFLGSVDYGAFAVVMIPTNIAILFQGVGVDIALTRFIAKYRSEGRKEDLWVITEAGLAFCVAFSLLIAGLLWSSSGWVAEYFLHDSSLESLLQIASLAVVGNTLLTTVQSILVGYERMELRNVTAIMWAVVKSIFSPLLVWLGLGPYGAVLGYSVGILLIGTLCVVLLYVYVRSDYGGASLNRRRAFWMMFVFGLPLFMAMLVTGGLQQLCNFLMALYVDKNLIGNYNAAMNFGVLVTVFTAPIAMALYPLFSKMSRGDDGLRIVFQSSVKYTTLITLPVTAALILLADPVVNIIYGSGFQFTAFYLKLYLLAFLFAGVGNYSVNSFFSGIGETRVSLNMNVISFVVGAPMAFLLIPSYGIVGVLVVQLVAPRVGVFYGLWWIKKTLGFSIETRSSLMIYVSVLAAYIGGFALLSLFSFNNWVSLFVGGGLFAGLYLLLLPVTGALTAFDLREFEAMSGGLGPLAPFIRLFVNLMRRLVKS